jgi:hypothetical protein
MDKLLAQLDSELAALLAEHEALLELIRAKKQAMTRSRPQEVIDLCQRENQSVQRIGQIEKRRQKLVGQLTAGWAPGATSPLTLGQIIERAGDRRPRLAGQQAKLRQLMTTIKDENETARRITDGLLRHVHGIFQQVTQAIGAAGTYGRRGSVTASTAAVSTFAVTG